MINFNNYLVFKDYLTYPVKNLIQGFHGLIDSIRNSIFSSEPNGEPRSSLADRVLERRYANDLAQAMIDDVENDEIDEEIEEVSKLSSLNQAFYDYREISHEKIKLATHVTNKTGFFSEESKHFQPYILFFLDHYAEVIGRDFQKNKKVKKLLSQYYPEIMDRIMIIASQQNPNLEFSEKVKIAIAQVKVEVSKELKDLRK